MSSKRASSKANYVAKGQKIVNNWQEYFDYML